MHEVSAETIVDHNDVASDRCTAIGGIGESLNPDRDRGLGVLQHGRRVHWRLRHVGGNHIDVIGHKSLTYRIVGGDLELVSFARCHASLSVSNDGGVSFGWGGRYFQVWTAALSNIHNVTEKLQAPVVNR